MTKFRSPIFASALILFLTAQLCFALVPAKTAVQNDTLKTLSAMPIHKETTRNIVDALASRHYVSTTLDDQLSAKIYDSYLENLDSSKSYFLAADIAEFNYLRLQLDDALKVGDVSPAYLIFNRYQQRVAERFEQALAILEQGVDQFDFTLDESLPLDRKDAPWAASSSELDELWRKRVKLAVLNLKLADKEVEKTQEVLTKRYQNRLSRTLQTNSEDVYQLFMNAFTRTYDPHTQYFSPRTSENFNINMSLSLEGIGAVLQREDEYTKIVSLVPAGPAEKSRQIYPDDKIVAVGQGTDGEMVAVIGWRLDEVVEMIRGKKATIVQLEVIPANAKDSTTKLVQIVRNTVKLEEQEAKSEIIEIEQFGHTHKIGVIDIPTFYIDFQALQEGNRDYKSTTRDVHDLLVKLIADGVEGVIIDLRDNGGGSLQEARTLTGLFIDRGPTVLVRNNNGRVDILNDRDIGTVYDGPLAVVVNRLSASASEIFAGAIQDYDRGLIIGNQTFGKGTVQTLLPLNQGQLKLTAAKFYRITGASTQHKGVLPDIDFPLDYDPESIGESTLEGPLPWDQIQPTSYRINNHVSQLKKELTGLHDTRSATDPEFIYMRDAAAYRQVRSKQEVISLNLATRQQDKTDSDDFWLNLENTKRKRQDLEPIASLDELNPKRHEPELALGPATDVITTGVDDGTSLAKPGPKEPTATPPALIDINGEAASDDSLPPLKADATPDPHLIESGNILLDLISLEKRMAAENRRQQPI